MTIIKPFQHLARRGRVGKIGEIKPREPRRAERPELPELGGGAPRQLSLIPESLAEVVRLIGEQRARRIMDLRERGLVGTLPELLVWDWLEQRELPFTSETIALGGRRERGGAVLDFVVGGLATGGLYVWRIMGEYWHTGPEVERKDEFQKQRIMGMRVGSIPVVGVVDLWERDIYDRYPEVFWMAEMGIGLRE